MTHELQPGTMTILDREYTAAVNTQTGDVWIRASDLAESFGIQERALRIRIQKSIRLEWQHDLTVPTAGGPQKVKFINQYAVAKLAGSSHSETAQQLTDEIIELGVRAKRGDLTLIEEVVDKHTATDTADDYERANFALQRELAKTSNKLRNTEIENRTRPNERQDAFQELSDTVNIVTTGKPAKRIKQLGNVQKTRDALSPAHLALQRFVELREVDMMRLHDAQGLPQIRRTTQSLHEDVKDMAAKNGLHDDRLIRDRRHDVKLSPEQMKALNR